MAYKHQFVLDKLTEMLIDYNAKLGAIDPSERGAETMKIVIRSKIADIENSVEALRKEGFK